MRYILSFFVYVLFIMDSYAQYQVTGYIVEENGEALIGANVFSNKEEIGVPTNEYGYFSISLLNKHNELSVSYIGFDSKVVFFSLSKDTSIVVELSKNNLLEEVLVKEKKEDAYSNSRLALPIETLTKIPTIGCESDIFKSLSLFPGITTGQEGSSSLFVRGGTPDQNLILLDGIPVYNATHLGGFFSIFNADAIKKIEVYKGNFPARYGGRLSSVIDVQTKEGNQKETHGNIGLGILTSRLGLEGPLTPKSSYFLTARTSYFGLINLFTDKEKVENYFDYWLYDINGKVNIRLKKGRVFFSSYFGNDIGTINSEDITAQSDSQVYGRSFNKNRIQWGNITMSSRYIYPVTSKLFSKLLVGFSKYHYKFKTRNWQETYFPQDTLRKETAFRNNSSVDDQFIVSNWDYSFNSNNQIKFGSGITFHHFTTASIDTSVNLDRLSSNFSKEVFAFAENKMSFRTFSCNVGLRWSHLFVSNKLYSNLEPRISIHYNLSEKLEMSAFFTKNNQYIHLLTNNGFGFPNNIWVPATKDTRPQNAIQYGMGFGWQVHKNYHLGIESYYRKMTNLIGYNSGVDPDEPPIFEWEKIINKGGFGKAYGIETILEKSKGKLTGFISYTLAWNFRKFTQLNDGKYFFHAYDRRHDLSIVSSYKLNEHWTLSSNWIFQTGSAVSLPIAAITVPGGNYQVAVYSGRNVGRMPNYHRLDVGAEYSKTTKRKNELKLKFSIYNLYNKKNPSFLFVHDKGIIENGVQVQTERSIKQISLFFLTPSASVEYKF